MIVKVLFIFFFLTIYLVELKTSILLWNCNKMNKQRTSVLYCNCCIQFLLMLQMTLNIAIWNQTLQGIEISIESQKILLLQHRFWIDAFIDEIRKFFLWETDWSISSLKKVLHRPSPAFPVRYSKPRSKRVQAWERG